MKLLIPTSELDSKRNQDPIPLECLQCGKTHYRTKNEVKRILKGTSCSKNRGCYCSRECNYNAKNIRKEYNCKQCGTVVLKSPSEISTTGNIFCSSSCAAKHTNTHRIRIKSGIVRKTISKQPSIKITRPDRFCLFCNSKILSQSLKTKCCNLTCNAKWKWKLKKELIDASGVIPPHKTNVLAKRYLIELRGHNCEMCNLTEWGNKPILLLVDHIDGNSNNCKLSNLRLICSNCDTLTLTYKGRNRGKGRHNRMKRYNDGLSY